MNACKHKTHVVDEQSSIAATAVQDAVDEQLTVAEQSQLVKAAKEIHQNKKQLLHVPRPLSNVSV